MANARHFAFFHRHLCRPWTPPILVPGVLITPGVEQPGWKPSSSAEVKHAWRFTSCSWRDAFAQSKMPLENVLFGGNFG